VRRKASGRPPLSTNKIYMHKRKKYAHRDTHILYTKDFFQTFAKLWDELSVEDMANKLGIDKPQVNYIAAKIRKAGYALTKKREHGVFQRLLIEAMDEIGMKRSR